MSVFGVLLNTPEVRAIVQEGLLEREFHDSLFPNLLFRRNIPYLPWPAEAGDSFVFSGAGLIEPDQRALAPDLDPDIGSYALEQWTTALYRLAKSIPVAMPTSKRAIVDLFMQSAKRLGLQAAMTMNRSVRNRLYAAGMAGWTNANGAGVASTSLVVYHGNGFTTARNPNTTGASKVRFSDISPTNPLAITIGASTSRNAIGWTPDTAGDEFGPGTLTLSAVATWSARDAVRAVDRSDSFFVGGGTHVDDITSTDIPTMQDIRTGITNLRKNQVKPMPDMSYRCHISPDVEKNIFADTELQRLLTGRIDTAMIDDFAVGHLLNTYLIANVECPVPTKVYPYDGVTWSLQDPFPGELYSTGASTGVTLDRMLFMGYGALTEYYMDPSAYITEAGITGKMGDLGVITNDGVEVVAERIKLIMRAPLNALQDKVLLSWLWEGDFPMRTDATSPGTAARHKRVLVGVCAAG